MQFGIDMIIVLLKLELRMNLQMFFFWPFGYSTSQFSMIFLVVLLVSIGFQVLKLNLSYSNNCTPFKIELALQISKKE